MCSEGCVEECSMKSANSGNGGEDSHAYKFRLCYAPVKLTKPVKPAIPLLTRSRDVADQHIFSLG
eukprot:19662-Eustigmatos_ZCMA.PRE.1